MAYEAQDYKEVIAALGEGSINVEGASEVALKPSKLNLRSGVITSKIALSDTEEKGFKELLSNKDKHIKILIQHE